MISTHPNSLKFMNLLFFKPPVLMRVIFGFRWRFGHILYLPLANQTVDAVISSALCVSMGCLYMLSFRFLGMLLPFYLSNYVHYQMMGPKFKTELEFSIISLNIQVLAWSKKKCLSAELFLCSTQCDALYKSNMCTWEALKFVLSKWRVGRLDRFNCIT